VCVCVCVFKFREKNLMTGEYFCVLVRFRRCLPFPRIFVVVMLC
jgi:hypothetical protein